VYFIRNIDNRSTNTGIVNFIVEKVNDLTLFISGMKPNII